MSRLWPARPALQLRPGEGAERVAAQPGRGRFDVLLSEHDVRYLILPWSAALRSSKDWLALARQAFAAVYGARAAAWDMRVCAARTGRARVACAADAARIAALAGERRVASVQPRLASVFNRRRREISEQPAWLVLSEPGRLTLGLIAGAEWQLIRSRQAGEDWRERLPDLLAREHAARGEPACERVLLEEAA